MERWFFIDDGPATGAVNMATDEFLLARAERKGMFPILRLYSFDPPAITIGYHQELDRALDMETVRADSVDVVRRVTGGRALLHDGELTYCVVAPTGAEGAGAASTVTYLGISAALAAALRSIGVAAEVSRGERMRGTTGAAAPCLLSTTRYELTARGRKIAGSARRAARGAFLQHGSILLTLASARIARYVRGENEALARRITSVSEELGREPDAAALRSSIREAFGEAFHVEWIPFSPTADDEREVRRLAVAKDRELSAGPAPAPRHGAPADNEGFHDDVGREVAS
jgi:lipoate-protein ligase A